LDCSAAPGRFCADYYGGSEVGAVTATDCNADQLAAYDFNVWFCGESNSGTRTNGVNSLLPSSVATVVCNDIDPPSGADDDACTNRSPHTVTIAWTEMNPNASAEQPTITQTVSLSMQP
jgi:hypothetical protein